MKKPINTNAKLWNKLTKEEQKQWIINYKRFEGELNKLSKIHNKISAHNLTYESIWGLQRG